MYAFKSIHRYICTYQRSKSMYFFLLKLFPKEKREKKKAIKARRTVVKPKGNGISPEGWWGNTTTRRSHLICPTIMP